MADRVTKHNILFVIESLGRGGAEQALSNLALELQRRGIGCEIAVLMGTHELATQLEESGIPVHRLDIGHRWNLAFARRRLLKIVRLETFSVVHAHLFFADVVVGLLPSDRYMKVATLHNLVYEEDHSSAWKRMRKRFHRWILCTRFQGMLGVSAAVAIHYERELGLSQVEVIPNGLPLALIGQMAAGERKVIRLRHGLPEDAILLVVPARLVPEKGHFILLEALELLRLEERERMGSVITILVGSGPLRRPIAESISARGWSNSVRMIPALPQSELFPLIGASDVYVSASVTEGLPLAVIEAAAIGIPVVATKVGGVPDAVVDGQTGILSSPGDPAALADAIRKVLRSPEDGKQMSRLGRNFVAEHFDVSVVASKLLSFYEKLLERKRLCRVTPDPESGVP